MPSLSKAERTQCQFTVLRRPKGTVRGELKDELALAYTVLVSFPVAVNEKL